MWASEFVSIIQLALDAELLCEQLVHTCYMNAQSIDEVWDCTGNWRFALKNGDDYKAFVFLGADITIKVKKDQIVYSACTFTVFSYLINN